ncbi:hypothetical protein B0H21DRAFT_75537 [Amylocystis lapponica]|nr:hypothetical protein B0H21DRAFT_75537 [Amylocystis lapponica]
MVDLAPEEEPPTEGANADRVPVPEVEEQHPVYSITLQVKADKTIDELTEEEAEELLKLRSCRWPRQAHMPKRMSIIQRNLKDLDSTRQQSLGTVHLRPRKTVPLRTQRTEDYPQAMDGEVDSGQISLCGAQAPPARATAVHTPEERWRRKRRLLDSKVPSNSTSTSTSQKRRYGRQDERWSLEGRVKSSTYSASEEAEDKGLVLRVARLPCPYPYCDPWCARLDGTVQVWYAYAMSVLNTLAHSDGYTSRCILQ